MKYALQCSRSCVTQFWRAIRYYCEILCSITDIKAKILQKANHTIAVLPTLVSKKKQIPQSGHLTYHTHTNTINPDWDGNIIWRLTNQYRINIHSCNHIKKWTRLFHSTTWHCDGIRFTQGDPGLIRNAIKLWFECVTSYPFLQSITFY